MHLRSTCNVRGATRNTQTVIVTVIDSLSNFCTTMFISVIFLFCIAAMNKSVYNTLSQAKVQCHSVMTEKSKIKCRHNSCRCQRRLSVGRRKEGGSVRVFSWPTSILICCYYRQTYDSDVESSAACQCQSASRRVECELFDVAIRVENRLPTQRTKIQHTTCSMINV